MGEEIRTARLVMRRWRAADRAPFAAMNADPQVMRYFAAPLTHGESDAFVDRIEAHFDEHGYGLWALEVDGSFAGFTGLSWVTWPAPFTPALEVGWRLAEAAWGHGYASEAATAALQRAFAAPAAQGAAGPVVDSIVSLTATTNRPSRRVMERIGLRYDGSFEHPRLAHGHPLRPHVLYRAERSSWQPVRRPDSGAEH